MSAIAGILNTTRSPSPLSPASTRVVVSTAVTVWPDRARVFQAADQDILEFGLPLNRVKEFLFRSRKIHRVEFMDVHLRHAAAQATPGPSAVP